MTLYSGANEDGMEEDMCEWSNAINASSGDRGGDRTHLCAHGRGRRWEAWGTYVPTVGFAAAAI